MTFPISGNWSGNADWLILQPRLQAFLDLDLPDNQNIGLPPVQVVTPYNLLVVGVTQQQDRPTWRYGGKLSAAYPLTFNFSHPAERIGDWQTFKLTLDRYTICYVPPVEGVQIIWTYYPPRWFWDYEVEIRHYQRPYFKLEPQHLTELWQTLVPQP